MPNSNGKTPEALDPSPLYTDAQNKMIEEFLEIGVEWANDVLSGRRHTRLRDPKSRQRRRDIEAALAEFILGLAAALRADRP